MNLHEAVYTVFDLETTGLYPYAGDRICEIGALRVDPRRGKADTFHALIDPRRPISPGAFRVNGITDEMVRDKPTIDEVLPDFLAFLGGSVLVAYNAGFDLGFLEAALGEDRHLLAGVHVIDALKLARRSFPHIARYNLGSVARHVGASAVAQHRAMSDALATWKVFQKELEVLRGAGVTRVEEIATRRVSDRSYSRTESQEKVRLIEEAIGARRQLAITYFSIWNNNLTKRTITPRSIQKTGDTAYVIAHCHLRNELRNFRLDCVVDVWGPGLAPVDGGNEREVSYGKSG